MHKNNHLENNSIIEYLDNLNLNNYKKITIEKHLFQDNCNICLEKYTNLTSFNNLIESSLSKGSLSTIEVKLCEYSNKIDNFLSNQMTSIERKTFHIHLEKCDECRNFVAEFIKNKSELFQVDNSFHLEPAWVSLENGNMLLKNFINSFICGIDIKNQNLFESPSTIYRGDSDDEEGREYQEIELPEGDGTVSLTLYPNNDIFNLEIKILNSANINSRIDIYANNTMLDSIDGNTLTFQIPDEEFRIMINDKYEIS